MGMGATDTKTLFSQWGLKGQNAGHISSLKAFIALFNYHFPGIMLSGHNECSRPDPGPEKCFSLGKKHFSGRGPEKCFFFARE